jgi:hypothetical protein
VIEEVPEPGAFLSISVTSAPRAAASAAMETPITPAPITAIFINNSLGGGGVVSHGKFLCY